MSAGRRVSLVLLLLCLCVGCDQATKMFAGAHLEPLKPITFLDGVFRLEHIRNPGVFLSLGADLSREARFQLFTVLVGVFLLGLLASVLTSSKMPAAGVLPLSLIIGGGLSNTLDRLLNDGYVVDFMSVRMAYFRTGIFNLADVEITLGIALLAALYVPRLIRRRVSSPSP